jgi:Fibronectin type III domain
MRPQGRPEQDTPDAWQGFRQPLLFAALLGLAIILNPAFTHAGYLDLAWNAPTTNADGAPLTDLSSYRVYFRTSTGSCGGGTNQSVPAASATPNPGTVTHRLTGLTTGTKYWVTVAAVDTGGDVSACSNEVSAVAASDVPPTLVAAVLPSSRSVQVGTPATAFATIINAGSSIATSCRISPRTSIPASFSFQTTNPATNQVAGPVNSPVDILAGQAQSFVFAFTPTAPFAATGVQLSFDCSNTDPAPVASLLNTLLLSASATPVPDIIAVAATPTSDGVLHIAGNTGAAAFAVATVNMGASASITAYVSTFDASVPLPLVLAICETNPATGQCISTAGGSVTTQINAKATATFAIFVGSTASIPFSPIQSRIFVGFLTPNGEMAGSTSVAVKTQ